MKTSSALGTGQTFAATQDRGDRIGKSIILLGIPLIIIVCILVAILLVQSGTPARLAALIVTLSPSETSTSVATSTPYPTAAPTPTINLSFDLRELEKNPERYRGQRLNVLGKILTTQESSGGTMMQLYDAHGGYNFEKITLVVIYPYSLPGAFRDSIVSVDGYADGSFTFQNAFGATLTQPLLRAINVDVAH